MNLHTHDPREYIRGIHQILISDKKRIGFLFGAGSSFATGIPSTGVPAVSEMTIKIVSEVEKCSEIYATAVNEIRAEIGDELFNIESLLSSIEAKRAVIGLCGRFGERCMAGLGRDLMANLFEMNHCQRPL